MNSVKCALARRSGVIRFCFRNKEYTVFFSLVWFVIMLLHVAGHYLCGQEATHFHRNNNDLKKKSITSLCRSHVCVCVCVTAAKMQCSSCTPVNQIRKAVIHRPVELKVHLTPGRRRRL